MRIKYPRNCLEITTPVFWTGSITAPAIISVSDRGKRGNAHISSARPTLVSGSHSNIIVVGIHDHENVEKGVF